MCTASVTHGSHDAGRDLRDGTCRVDQGGCLTHDTADGEDHAGEDSRDGAGQNHTEHRTQFSGSQTKASLTVHIRNGFQSLLCRTHHQRKIMMASVSAPAARE